MPTDRIIVAGNNTTDGSPVVMTSEDLVTWFEVDPWPGADANYVSVAGDYYFVNTAAASTPNNYAYSDDGDTYTLASATPALNHVVWTGSKFIAIANNGASAYSSTTAAGSWSAISSTGTSGVLTALTYGKDVLVGSVRTSGTTDPIFYSTDAGASWSTYDPPTDLTGVHHVAYGGGSFVAVRSRTATGRQDAVIRSDSGTSWAVIDTGYDNFRFYALAYGLGRFVAVGDDPSGNVRSIVSTDGGLTWTLYTPSGLFTTGLFSTAQMTFWAGQFALVNPLSGSIYTSPDGQTWTAQAFANRDWRGIDAGVAVPGRILGWKVGMI